MRRPQEKLTVSTVPRNNRENLRADRGFSLVELVVVVAILAVIVAIAVPRMANAVKGTDESALRKTLMSLRTAIDAFAAEHSGAFPGSIPDGLGNAADTAAAFESHLLKYSNSAGQAAASPDSDHRFGPYLRQIPPVPVGSNRGKNGIAIDASNSPPLVTLGVEGWVYNPKTGQIIANSDDVNQAGTRTFDEY